MCVCDENRTRKFILNRKSVRKNILMENISGPCFSKNWIALSVSFLLVFSSADFLQN